MLGNAEKERGKGEGVSIRKYIMPIATLPPLNRLYINKQPYQGI